MSTLERINQRDLRLRSREIMDAVEGGESFIVTRDGRSMGQLIPLRRRFVSREQFAIGSQYAQTPDLEHFRADQELWLEGSINDPYAR